MKVDTKKIKSALPIERLLVHYGAQRTSTNQYWCILHEKGGSNAGHKTPSLVVHPNSQTITCMSQKCFDGDDIFGVIAKVNNLNIKSDYPKIIEMAANIAGVSIVKNQAVKNRSFMDSITPLTEEHKIYLLDKRKISEETISKAGYRSFKDKIVFIYKSSDSIIGYKAKTIYSKDEQEKIKTENPDWQPYFIKGNKNDLYLWEPLMGKKIIYLVAGEYDSAVLYQEIKKVGLNNEYGILSMTTGEATGIKEDVLNTFKQLDCEEFRVIYDFDATGLREMPKRAQELLKTGKKVFTFEWREEMKKGKIIEVKDINDYFIEKGNINIFLDESNFKEQFAGVEDIEVANFKLLHPSLDIKEDIVLFGFRALMKDATTQNIFLVSRSNKIEITKSDKFQINENEYRLDLRKRLLEPIEERWHFQEMKEFAKNPIRSENIIIDLAGVIKKYSDLPEENDYILLSAWITGTYFFRIFCAYPFLHLKAPKKSGKSQQLDILYRLAFNAKKARATFAALVDTVDSLRGTYIMDQADILNNPLKEEIREILTDSYKTEGGKRRMIDFGKNKERQVIESETYCPKALASIKEIPEDLRDRCLIIPMIRSAKNFPSPDEQSENWHSLRGNLYKFTLTRHKEILPAYRQIIEKYRNDQKMIGRLAELWIPLEAILFVNGISEEKIVECRKLFVSRYGFTEYAPSEQEEAIIVAIISQFNDQETLKISPKEITDLIDIELTEEERKKFPQKIGWMIKKFNLASDAPKRYGKGMKYELSKSRVEKIYQSYFKEHNIEKEPTPSYTEDNLSVKTEGI